MSVQLIIDNREIPVGFVTFSDGASNCKLQLPDNFVAERFITITIDPITPVDRYIIEIGLIISAVRSNVIMYPDVRVILNIPYLPYGRADRVFERGNSFPLNLFIALIRDTFHAVILCDPHSNYAPSHLNLCGIEVTVKTQAECFLETVPVKEYNTVLVSPDKGAEVKIKEIKKALYGKGKVTPVVCASKKRDVTQRGAITETTLPDFNFSGLTAIIVDDIIDGGGTFIPLAKKLKEAGAERVELYVTHGIFAKGLAILRPHIDHLYAYQTVLNYVNQTDILNFNLGKEVK